MPTVFYRDETMSGSRAALEAQVLLWPDVRPQVLLVCPSYLACEHPFAVLVDGSLLLPPLPGEVLLQAPAAQVTPLVQDGLALEGWLRVRARVAEEVANAAPLVRAAYEAVRTACQ